ncbi:MAG: DNA-directed RNA polymerase subunit alpha [Deltaproteobacteria bacterium]|nr:DNA-directed RNA polymerase subunit alpha [Deltaproteobacteria bacterium]
MYRHWVMLKRPKELETDRVTPEGDFGQFSCAPLERGFGLTLGNALRRILISSIRGAAITSARFEGAEHEFSSLPDIVEDVSEIILNLKDVRLRMPEGEARNLSIDAKGPCTITAGDLKHDPLVEILNPGLHVATINEGGRLKVQLTAAMGVGYVPAASSKSAPVGTIAMDAVYTPVRRVNFKVTNARVEQMTDLDKLTLEIWTDGSIHPREALGLAAKILKEQVQVFIGFDEGLPGAADYGLKSDEPINPNLFRPVEELELSVRSANCLKNANIRFIGELVQKSEAEMLKTKNFGRKSLKEIKEVLGQMGLALGMEVKGFDPDNVPRHVKDEL